jgi:large subunit ribosomal protein L10
MTVEEVNKLRSEFRKSGVEYHVVKNSLVEQAIKDKAWSKSLGSALVGSTGIAWCYDDPSAAAKVVKAFRVGNQKLKVKAGLVEGQFLDDKAVESQLATMPGKKELQAMLLATMQAPLQNFVALLQAPAQNLAYLFAAKEKKAES